MTSQCRHRACGALIEDGDDPLLPDHIKPYVCETCGERYLLDTDTATFEVDA